MNFRHYEALYWIVRSGSFHAAARQLKSSQPAISGRIRQLEQSLGITLFERVDRGVRLTPQGYELLPYATQLVEISAEIQRKISAPEALSGHVRLGITNIHAITWIPTLLLDMAHYYPEVHVIMTIDTSDTINALLERGQLDIGIMTSPVGTSRHASAPLGSVENVWVASAALKLPDQELTARDLTNYSIISDRPGTALHTAMMDWFRAEGVEPQRNHSCSQLTTRIHLAARGIGIALAARSSVLQALEQQNLVILATCRPAPPLNYAMAYSDIDLSPCGKAVVEMMHRLIARKPSLDAFYAAGDSTLAGISI